MNNFSWAHMDMPAVELGSSGDYPLWFAFVVIVVLIILGYLWEQHL